MYIWKEMMHRKNTFSIRNTTMMLMMMMTKKNGKESSKEYAGI
jgi:hypothetical protein